jgi:hypothetical protein
MDPLSLAGIDNMALLSVLLNEREAARLASQCPEKGSSMKTNIYATVGVILVVSTVHTIGD